MYESKCGYPIGIGTFDNPQKMLEQLDRDFPKLGKILYKMKKRGALATTELQEMFYKSYTLLEIREIHKKWDEEKRKRPIPSNLPPKVALLKHLKRRI